MQGRADFLLAPTLVTAAHEIKAPLALIRQLAEAIENGDLEPGEITQYAERIGLTSEKSLRLAADITRQARLADGLFELEPVDPLPVCQDAIAELVPLYRARGVEIRLQRKKSLPLVVAHRDLLRRILINFADNALHYGSSDEPVEVTSTYRRSQDKVRISVRDHGPGISRELKRRLQRDRLIAPSRLAYRPQSSGLGLFIAGQFAAAMQAEIGVNEHRDGVSFYVDLPRSTQIGLW